MPRNDVDQAAYLWGKGMEELFEFAIHAHTLVGKGDDSVDKLAKRIRRHRSTVENYAKGGALWLAMLEQKPSEAEIIRDELEISFWNTVGRLYCNQTISLDGAHHWLREAIDNKMTVEHLRSLLPNSTGQSTMKAQAVKIANLIEKEIINAPAFDVLDSEYRIIRRLGAVMVKMLRKVAE